eukprot:3279758-Amphidinium_carterae.1
MEGNPPQSSLNCLHWIGPPETLTYRRTEAKRPTGPWTKDHRRKDGRGQRRNLQPQYVPVSP